MTEGNATEQGATGFFHVRESNGVWWIIDPGGRPFLSKGVNHVSFRGDPSPALRTSPYRDAVSDKYEGREEWAAATAARLKGWGFNTIGSWSDQSMFGKGLAYTLILDIGAKSGGDWQRGLFPDVFSDSFRQAAESVAAAGCAQRRDDPLLLGYFTDNELRWGPDWRSDQGLLADFWGMPEGSPGRATVRDFVREHYGEVERLNEAWGSDHAGWDQALGGALLGDLAPAMAAAQKEIKHDWLLSMASTEQALAHARDRYGTVDRLNAEQGSDYASLEDAVTRRPLSPQARELIALDGAFVGQVAEQYFRVCADAIRRHDPNHMILGCRFAVRVPRGVIAGMAPHVDLVSHNEYAFEPDVEKFRQVHEWSGRPVMLTEFSFKALDSGLPCTKGAATPVATQTERADCFERYVTALMALPFMVGYHWFQYTDQPAEGRFDGENSNYGLVTIDDEPWELLTARMAQVNARVTETHGDSGR